MPSSPPRYRNYVGIDPGASGAVSVLCPAGPTLFPLADLTDLEVWSILDSLGVARSADDRHAFAVIERVGGFIKGNPAPGSAMFKFGCGYGKLLMALTAAGIPFEEATPQAWQKGLAIPPRGKKEDKGAFKRRLKQKAEQLFPNERVTLATCDALLIAEWCRRRKEGGL